MEHCLQKHAIPGNTIRKMQKNYKIIIKNRLK